MKKRALSFALCLCLCLGLSVPAWAAEATFTDVPTTHWSYSYVERAVNEGWIGGYGDGRFGPNDQVTYAQLSTMLIQAFFPEVPENFMGPASSVWYERYCASMAFMGLYDGTRAGQDGGYASVADQPVSRYEVAQLLSNVLWYDSVELNYNAASVQAGIADWNRVPGNYQDALTDVVGAGIIGGIDDRGTFDGSSYVTRGQAAVIMTRLNEVIENGGAATDPTEPEQPSEPEQPQESEENFVDAVLRLVNEERAKEGLSPMTTNDTLNGAAQVRAEELQELFDHTRPDGSSCFTALDEAGVRYWTAGENIAAGAATPESVMNMWMNSEGHRANILNESFDAIGVGRVGNYWVQMFVGG